MRSAVLAFILLAPAAALAGPAQAPAVAGYKPLCPDHTCKTLVAVDANGHTIRASAPTGYGAPDIQAMFDIDPTLGAGMTVALVDAYGYQEIEADLAAYRTQYGLPACTIASGCLTVLNNVGATSPLAGDTDQGWIGETALDVQMVSAVCPLCKIVVVQADSSGQGLFVGQGTAAKLDVDAISDSWSSDEYAGVDSMEGNFNLAGVGVFSATGDDGYNATAQYPSTSAYVVAVGGIGVGSGGPIAWSGAGSSCSTVIPKPAFQPGSVACNMRAAADTSAIAFGNPGIATYVLGSWTPVEGTSAATPIVAATMAAAGHGDARPGFVYKHADAFVDVTTGTNGTCGSNLCDAALGWDGPTGVGTPDQSKIKLIGGVAGAGPAVQFTYPTDGITVDSGFSIQVAPDPAAMWVDIQVDGMRLGKVNVAPYTIQAPASLAAGPHTLTAIAYDLDHNSQMTSVGVTIGTPDDGGGGGGGGSCSAGGTPGAGTLIVLLGALKWRRRRRS